MKTIKHNMYEQKHEPEKVKPTFKATRTMDFDLHHTCLPSQVNKSGSWTRCNTVIKFKIMWKWILLNNTCTYLIRDDVTIVGKSSHRIQYCGMLLHTNEHQIYI